MNALADYAKRKTYIQWVSFIWLGVGTSVQFLLNAIFFLILFHFFVCLFAVVVFAVSGGDACLYKNVNKTVIFWESYVSFRILNKVLLTDSLNFASKRIFPSFSNVWRQYKGQNKKFRNLGNFKDFTSFEQINGGRTVWFTKCVLGILIKRQILKWIS